MSKTQTKQQTVTTATQTPAAKTAKKTRTMSKNPQKLLADCRHPRHILVEMVKTRKGYEIVGGIINVGVNQHKFYTVPVSGQIIQNDIINTSKKVASTTKSSCGTKTCSKTEKK